MVSNFTYLVRLHFCEFQLSRTNQRVFDIFINHQTAQATADVLAWADSKKGVPVYKDFVIYVRDGNGVEELWVALHPSVSIKPEFYDVILNGLESFTVNERSGTRIRSHHHLKKEARAAEFCTIKIQ